MKAETVIFGNETLPDIIGQLLRKKKLMIAIAESCTGGLIAHELTNIPGSSDYFATGIVAYSNASKIDILGVPAELIRNYGAVSEQVAASMAERIRTISGADIGLSTTGIAGPGGASDSKPVGLIYIGICYQGETNVQKYVFTKDRLLNKHKFAYSALDMIRLKIS